MRKRFSLLTLLALVLVIAMVAILPVLALAQTAEAPHDDVMLGHYALPVILMVVLSVIYWVANDSIPNQFKPLIALGVGVVLGIFAMFYAELKPTFINVVDYVLYGLMAGAAAIGLYEGKKALSKDHR